ncbi:hypothetical protein Q4601_04300 [Shewanella sp. 1_MG-2023]|uniref:Uncharacterized protein n=1 Tax=Shewanella electrodiphila TaxID=934143 RepID=A0ABT0KPH1_9GAMM|nr:MULTISPECIES: hypothetical protein [Shewanella]MCC4832453.1 hypothetical protein [Shewanella sp. 10N.7]MCL1045741.1 hypothetical protein [Shewanella electrodiphila]MDO6610772.1 hypothetical protein [Shewanella sp. 7_MG-2023]MDO6770377.1 hypothetical protein [Shewanella sp. 2_MG-2023]MDO6793518.1 hypothetical protein [Shewanella sp. 1_MG-2023]
MKKLLVISSVLITSIGFSSALLAQEQQRQKRKPPQEAYTLCEDKTENDVVNITTPKGDEISATCQMMDDQLVAVPEDHKPPQRQKR